MSGKSGKSWDDRPYRGTTLIQTDWKLHAGQKIRSWLKQARHQEVSGKPEHRVVCEACGINVSSKLSVVKRHEEHVLVQVPGSVEEERTFSAMAYLKNKQRNRLLSAHLNAAMRLFLQRQHTLATFPYPIAMQHWRSGAQKRGRYGMAGKQ